MSSEAEQDAQSTGQVPTARALCVLLSDPQRTPAPPELRRVLDRKGVTVVPCPDAYGAMAAIVQRRHRAGPRAPTVLLVVEPDQTPQSAELASNVRKYAPAVVCWRYSQKDEQPLGILEVPSEVVVPEPKPRHNGAAAGPQLRLTGDPFVGEEPQATEDADEAPEDDSGPVLTDEELRMLLSDDPEDEPRRGRGT
jgi:hypothetical protein